MAIPSELLRGSIEPILLSLLNERAMHGYEMIKLVNARTSGALEWKEGTIYPWLHRLEADGLITSEWQAPVDGRRRKVYHLTRQGQRQLAQRTQEWRTFSESVNLLLAGPASA